jgi:hypothetical protein
MAVILLTAVQQLEENGTDITVNHTFLEDGHPQLEADIIHAAIGNTKKNRYSIKWNCYEIG